MRRSLLILTLALGACGGEELELEIGARSAPIVNGTIDTGHPAVGMIIRVVPDPDDPQSTYESFCSATLVGKRTVLTAAHCIEQGVEISAFEAEGLRYPATSWVNHPLYDNRASLPADYPQEYVDLGHEWTYAHDIAIVRLAAAPPLDPYAISVEKLPLAKKITFVGFGQTSTDDYDSGGIKRITTNTIKYVDTNNIYSPPPGGSVGNTCFGDSGGPAFVRTSETEVVVAVTSHGVGERCETVDGANTRVDVHLDWLKEVSGGDLLVHGEEPPISQDTTPPQVQILSPMPNATVDALTTVTAQITDDGEIQGALLRVDGVDAGSLQQGPYLFQVSLTAGAHTIEVVARDAAGNEGRSSVSVISSGGAVDTPARPTSTAAHPVIIGSCSVGASASDLGLPLALFALLLVRRRRAPTPR